MNNVLSLAAELYDDILPHVVHDGEICEECLMRHIVANHLAFQRLVKERFPSNEQVEQFFEQTKEVAYMFEHHPLETMNCHSQYLSVN